jgi:hypothetical protein
MDHREIFRRAASGHVYDIVNVPCTLRSTFEDLMVNEIEEALVRILDAAYHEALDEHACAVELLVDELFHAGDERDDCALIDAVHEDACDEGRAELDAIVQTLLLDFSRCIKGRAGRE